MMSGGVCVPIFWVCIDIHNIRCSRGIAGFQRDSTSSLIRSRNGKLQLTGPRGVGPNSKPRLMIPPEG